MTKEYYQIKDKCREGLLEYLAEAVSMLPEANNPRILDIGCGSGIPTIWLAEKYGGTITAIDTDKDALNWLQKKIINKDLENQIKVINISFNALKEQERFFDIILAEGFLNVIGFEQGFVKLVAMLKGGGYFVIHDEYKDHEKKCDFIRKNNCRKFSSEQVAERANISRPTLLSLEKGSPNVSIGAYVKVLFVLGLVEDISHVAKDDILGRKLQDAKLIVKKRASKIRFKNNHLETRSSQMSN